MSKETKSPDKYTKNQGAAEGGGSSNGFRVKKASKQVVKGQPDKEYHVKLPSQYTHNSNLHKADFPTSGAQLTAQQLLDQELTVQKTMAADTIWGLYLGKDNVAKTSHIFGSFEPGQQEQHFMSSRIEPGVEVLSDCTTTRHIPKTDQEKKEREEFEAALFWRPTMDHYHGQPIDGPNAMVAGSDGQQKPIVGFGQAAAIMLLVGSPDAHPGNFALKEEDNRIQLKKYDNKFDLGATGQFDSPFFEADKKEGLEDNKDIINESIFIIDCFNKSLMAEELDKLDETNKAILTKSFNNTKTEIQTLLNKRKCQDLSQEDQERVYEIMKVSDCCKGLPANIYVVEILDESDDFGSFKEKIDSLMSEYYESAMTSQWKNIMMTSIFPQNINKSGTIIESLQYQIPEASQKDDVYRYAVYNFRFPFPNGFATSKQVQDEFYATMYLIVNTPKEKLAAVLKANIDEQHHPEAIKAIGEQLELNQTRLKAIERSPEYLAYVADHQKELTVKLEAVINAPLEKEPKLQASNPMLIPAPYQDKGAPESGHMSKSPPDRSLAQKAALNSQRMKGRSRVVGENAITPEQVRQSQLNKSNPSQIQ